MPQVQIVGLTKRFGSIVALEDVDLDIRDKEYLSIIGPSGCGKSTLIKCIAGIMAPDKGKILVDDHAIGNVPIQHRRIGYVFQEIALFPHMRIIENVSYGPRVRGQTELSAKALVNELLNLIKLSDRVNSLPMELSGGAQQKVAVARALASGSALLLFDEPFGALDSKVRADLRYEIRKMTTDLGLTVLHVTHDQEEAMSISDRVVVMKAGRVIEDGTPLQLYLHPKMIFTANFLGEANFLRGRVSQQTSTGVIVQVEDTHLQTTDKTREVGQEVIVAIRPEFISVARGQSDKNCLRGKVVEIRFMGQVVRYEVEIAGGGTICVEHPTCFGELEIEPLDEVTLTTAPQHVMVYSVPEQGLERELQLE